MFIILSVINIPIYFIYAGTTEHNNYKDIDLLFKYFTLGNLGRSNLVCGHSDLKEKYITGYGKEAPLLNLTCTTGKITKIIDFGLLYQFDKSSGQPDSGAKECYKVKNPMSKATKSTPGAANGRPGSAATAGVVGNGVVTNSSAAAAGGKAKRQLTGEAGAKEASLEGDALAAGESAADNDKDAKMHVFFEDINDKTYLIKVNKTDTVKTLIELIGKQYTYDPKSFFLFYKNQRLKPNQTLRDANITKMHKI